VRNALHRVKLGRLRGDEGEAPVEARKVHSLRERLRPYLAIL
jgi:hypothetical protein